MYVQTYIYISSRDKTHTFCVTGDTDLYQSLRTKKFYTHSLCRNSLEGDVYF